MAEITAGQAYGFFTDTSVCIGCKACEVACKQWNQLPGNEPTFLNGFDNTGSLDSQNWRHVQFIDNVPDQVVGTGEGRAWLMMSDVCKHCQHASCMEVCPTGAIIRTEFDTVFIQPSVCNGCRDCIAACPYDVIGFDQHANVVQKCTLCYDRLQGGLEPACAKACPTDSIQFGPLDQLHQQADKRLADLHSQGVAEAQLYGRDDSVYGGLNAFFLLMDKPAARLGYTVAFPIILVCPILLAVDLGKPALFWHMLVNTTAGAQSLNFKARSPMSIGSWALLVFSLFAAVSFLEALVHGRVIRLPLADRSVPLLDGTAGKVWNVVGAALGLFVAGYTGVLLAVSNQPVWSDTWTLGGLFLASGLSGSAALLVLLVRYRPEAQASAGVLTLMERR